MYLHFSPFPVQWLFRQYTWRKKASPQKTIYLTFDDGPVPKVSPFVLDVLKEYSAKATFFCVGENVRKYPDILERMVKEGHTIGNHTYHHLNGYRNGKEVYLDDVDLCEKELTGKGVPTKLFRPPYGLIRSEQSKMLLGKYEIIMWDVLSADYDPSLSPQKCLQKSIRYTRNGSIIVFHDNPKAFCNLSWVLPRYMEHFASRGFAFCAL